GRRARVKVYTFGGMSGNPEYLLRAVDGRDYAADRVALLAWAAERRITRDQRLFDVRERTWTTALAVLGDAAFPTTVPLTPQQQASSGPRVIIVVFLAIVFIAILTAILRSSSCSSSL